MPTIASSTAKSGETVLVTQPVATGSLPVAVTAASSDIPLEVLKQYSSQKPVLVQSVQVKHKEK